MCGEIVYFLGSGVLYLIYCSHLPLIRKTRVLIRSRLCSHCMRTRASRLPGGESCTGSMVVITIPQTSPRQCDIYIPHPLFTSSSPSPIFHPLFPLSPLPNPPPPLLPLLLLLFHPLPLPLPFRYHLPPHRLLILPRLLPLPRLPHAQPCSYHARRCGG